MAKTKISEFDANPANNTDINGINVAEGCAPSGINNAIRQLMSDLKEQQTGSSGDNFTVGGNLAVTGTTSLSDDLILNSSSGTSGQVVVSQGSGSAPIWGNAFVAGMIMMWSGSIASVPTGWQLCDGTNGSPDLRNKFVVGAGSTYAVNATGGSADAVVVSHTHTATSTVTDPGHTHVIKTSNSDGGTAMASDGGNSQTASFASNSNTTGITVATTNASTGVSGTNANLPPYLALAYIIKS